MGNDSRPCIVNFHIPRTGGRTRTNFLSTAADSKNTFHTMGDQKREISEYLQMPIGEKRKIRLVTGHMPLQLLKSVPSPKFCITFLRNPLHRAISHYKGFKAWKGHCISDFINNNNVSLGDFLLSGIRHDIYDNVMVRYFLDNPPPFMQVEEKHLVEAKSNLGKYIDFIGITEHSAFCLQLLARILGLKNVSDVPHVGNMNQKRKLAGLSSYDLKALHATNVYDLDFFDYSVKLFKKQIEGYKELSQIEC